MVCAWREPPDIGEIEILGDEKTLLGLGSLPHVWVRATRETFRDDRVNVVPQHTQALRCSRRHVLVQLDPHATFKSLGAGGGAGRSSAAEAAAKAMAARTSSSVRVGKSERSLSVRSP
jgi:hypothetical protein